MAKETNTLNGDVEMRCLTNGNRENSTKSTNHKTFNSKCSLSMYIHVSFFAIIGCLTRLAIDYMMGKHVFQVEDSSTVIFVSFFSNMFGCFVLGFLTTSPLTKTGPYGAVATGISTGKISLILYSTTVYNGCIF